VEKRPLPEFSPGKHADILSIFLLFFQALRRLGRLLKMRKISNRFFEKKPFCLWIKAQQDAFLHHVESGLITLIGATTENPSFEVIPPLMSRCRLITLKSLSPSDITVIIENALKDKQRGLGQMNLAIDKDALTHLVRISDGDARTALNGLETTALLIVSNGKDSIDGKSSTITLQNIEGAMERKALLYDKSGEEHYNLISAFHKSLRGNDPDAAVYYIGNADPNALGIALSAMEAFRFLGHPEGELALSQAAIYLASAPKSNSIYVAYGKVKAVIDRHGALPVPLHIRNAPTALMRGLGYGKDYKYAHDYEDAYVPQNYLPERLEGQRFYLPTERGHEKRIKGLLEKWRSLQEKKKTSKESKS